MASTQFAYGTSESAAQIHPVMTGGGTRAGQSENSKLWIFFDFCTVVAACFISDLVFHRTHGSLSSGLGQIQVPAIKLAFLFCVFCSSLVLISHRFSLYRPAWIGGYLHEQRLTVQASLSAGLITSGMLYLVHAAQVPRSLVLTSIALVTTLLCSRRLIQHHVSENRRLAGISSRHILIIGSDPEAEVVRLHLENLRHLGYRVRGHVPLPSSDEGYEFDEIKRIFEDARSNFIDEIFLVSPHRAGIAQQMLEWARDFGIDLRIVPSLYDGLTWNRATEYIGQFPTFPLHRGEMPEFSIFLKHSTDLVISAIGLTLLALPMLVIAILIKLDSPGPILYRSERVGRKGRIIKCTKFRTMIADADRKRAELQHLNERSGILFKISNDPRITRIGRFLRKYSIDELPQLFDVLRGDMSIVGPRPPIASEVKQYKAKHLRRLEVTPGITGLWQVQARQDPSFDSYVSLDIAYIENWSIWLDIKIIVRTIGVVFAGTGS